MANSTEVRRAVFRYGMALVKRRLVGLKTTLVERRCSGVPGNVSFISGRSIRSCGRRGPAQTGLHIGQVEFKYLAVVHLTLARNAKTSAGPGNSSGNALNLFPRFDPWLSGILQVSSSIGKKAHSCAILRCHIGNRCSVGQGQGGCTFAKIFHEFSYDLGGAEHLGTVQHEVRRGDPPHAGGRSYAHQRHPG